MDFLTARAELVDEASCSLTITSLSISSINCWNLVPHSGVHRGVYPQLRDVQERGGRYWRQRERLRDSIGSQTLLRRPSLGCEHFLEISFETLGIAQPLHVINSDRNQGELRRDALLLPRGVQLCKPPEHCFRSFVIRAQPVSNEIREILQTRSSSPRRARRMSRQRTSWFPAFANRIRIGRKTGNNARLSSA